MTEAQQTPREARTEAQTSAAGARAAKPAAPVRPRRVAAAQHRRAKAEQAMKHWVRDTPAKLHRRPAPAQHAPLPELAPSDRAKPAPSIMRELEGDGVIHLPGLDVKLTSSAIKDESTDFMERAEAHDDTARLTVYALNGILLLMSFPVGMGMLIFNILGGENLRTTAHMIALTGLGIALNTTEMGSQILNVV